MLVNDIMIHMAQLSVNFNTVVRLHRLNKELYNKWIDNGYKTLLLKKVKKNVLKEFEKTKHAKYIKRMVHIKAYIQLDPMKIIEKITTLIPCYKKLKQQGFTVDGGHVYELFGLSYSRDKIVDKSHVRMLSLITKLIESNLGWRIDYDYTTCYNSKITIDCGHFRYI